MPRMYAFLTTERRLQVESLLRSGAARTSVAKQFRMGKNVVWKIWRTMENPPPRYRRNGMSQNLEVKAAYARQKRAESRLSAPPRTPRRALFTHAVPWNCSCGKFECDVCGDRALGQMLASAGAYRPEPRTPYGCPLSGVA